MPGLRTPGEQPLYEIVRARILERLRTGQWTAGDKIPTEPQLAEEFGVGIGTIRRAVEELVAERLLIRRAGRGTIVAKFADEHAFDHYFSFVDTDGELMKVTARLLRFGKERASPALAATLKLARGARLATADNLRLHDDVPVMLDRLWFPLDVFPDLEPGIFEARRGSIYGFYQEHFGISVVRVVEDLGGAIADEEVARALNIEVGAPVLRIERTAYTFKDQPVEFRVRYVDSSRCSYRNVRGLQD
ncbi:GntR family transcriptional regulator [Paraburkholderia phytofirmans]|jgi:GntR family transcriptional regulator|uniref:GntR family transcriptional regulator n=1 Tax=unclassified Paraburkholderia TaxID=2615204 RepID=UPI001053491B|nr:GntR family transcriptional regulator [Paraburkholderia sp. BL9I2N2]TCK86942.1 GntR family transcriptional regulator [Paraburkholderia sp. BL9I2N2]